MRGPNINGTPSKPTDPKYENLELLWLFKHGNYIIFIIHLPVKPDKVAVEITMFLLIDELGGGNGAGLDGPLDTARDGL